jgi:hypothetical protein
MESLDEIAQRLGVADFSVEECQAYLDQPFGSDDTTYAINIDRDDLESVVKCLKDCKDSLNEEVCCDNWTQKNQNPPCSSFLISTDSRITNNHHVLLLFTSGSFEYHHRH